MKPLTALCGLLENNLFGGAGGDFKTILKLFSYVFLECK